MQWHLLNQLYVNLDSENSKISVLEEVVSSDLELVRLLVSGTVSHRTMSLVGQDVVGFSPIGAIGLHSD